MAVSAATDAQLRGLIAGVRGLLEVQQAWGLEGLDVPETALLPRARPQMSAPAATEHTHRPAHPPAASVGADGQRVLLEPVESGASGPRPSLQDVATTLGDCQRCKLAAHRTHLVFGTGAPDARLMIVGEAPGRDEDLQGEPFVGAAGQLLDRMLSAMGLARQEVYIANMLKCRPPKNRFPEADEVASCQPFLLQQIRSVSPQVLLILGRCAAQALLRTSTPLGRLRGRFCEVAGVRALPSFHPAYLLRNPADKKLAWQDLQQVMQALAQAA